MHSTVTQHTYQKQRGSISLFGASMIAVAMVAFLGVMEVGNKMVLDRNFDLYAQSLAPTALRHEISISDSNDPTTLSQVTQILADLGLTVGQDVAVTLRFGNMQTLDEPIEHTDPASGTEYTVTEQFVPLATNASNPKKDVTNAADLPQFSAIAVELTSMGGLFTALQAHGRAVYGISPQDLNDPDTADCFCDARFNACLTQPQTNAVMGEADSSQRQDYCENGFAPAVNPTGIGAVFGAGHTKYFQADSVQFSPQWVGRPSELPDNSTDTSTTAWETIMADAPLAIVNGGNPFPEAHWDPKTSAWVAGKLPMQFNGKFHYVKWTGFVGTTSETPHLVSGLFYVGRTATCARPADPRGFFSGIMHTMIDASMNFATGNTDCLRYTSNPQLTRNYGTRLQPIMQSMYNGLNGIAGAAEYYYSCRDFSGIPQARSGFFQLMVRLFTRTTLDWNRKYQEADCAVRKMRFFGWWSFDQWRA